MFVRSRARSVRKADNINTDCRDHMGSSTSNKLIGLHGLLRRQLYFFFLFFYFLVRRLEGPNRCGLGNERNLYEVQGDLM
jgi:hypothetical protein